MAASHRRLGERAGGDAMNGTQNGSVAIAVASVLLFFCFLTLILVTKHLACQVSTPAAHQAADARDDSRLHRREWWKFVV
jgi:hypothetical protein